MKKKILFFSIILLMNLQYLFSQNSISGQITNKDNSDNLENVNVFIPELQKGTVSGINGTYKISNIPKGTFTIPASKGKVTKKGKRFLIITP